MIKIYQENGFMSLYGSEKNIFGIKFESEHFNNIIHSVYSFKPLPPGIDKSQQLKKKKAVQLNYYIKNNIPYLINFVIDNKVYTKTK